MIDLSGWLLKWFALALLVFWFVGAHNRLVRLRAAALQAFATLDTALMRQVDFVQAAAAPHLLAPEVGVVVPRSPDYSMHATINASATQLVVLLSATRARPLDPRSCAALTSALHAMIDAWQQLHPQASHRFEADGTLSRPADLLASGERPQARTILPPPLAWPEPSATAEIARAQFNLSVARYNTAVRQFPASLVAWLFRLRPGSPIC